MPRALAQNLERVLREEGRNDYADQFKGYDWKTEEDAFMDGYNANTGKIVTYDRLRAMGNNGVQEPVVDFKDGKLVGTKRLYTDGKFDRHGRDDKKALFCAGAWRGLQAPGKAAQKATTTPSSSTTAGRTSTGRTGSSTRTTTSFPTAIPFPFIEINPDDMAELGVKPGDLVEVYNDVGATQAMAYPSRRRAGTRPSCCSARRPGTQGNVINAGVNELSCRTTSRPGRTSARSRMPGRGARDFLQVEGVHGLRRMAGGPVV